MEKTIRQQIGEKIKSLPPYHQLAFGVILSERFLPNYFAFFLMEQWGNPMVLLNGIDLLKNIVSKEEHDDSELQLIDELIEAVTPDMDEFPGNTLASLALDVSSMLHECFLFARDKNTRHIALCSEISLDTLGVYVQKRDELPHDLPVAELNKYFSKDELISNEIEYQINLLNELKPTLKISNKLYMDKTIKAPNLSFSHLPGLHRRVAV